MTHVFDTASPTAGSPYQAYAYAYPHKTAYRPLASPIPLVDVWADEPKDALFLYVHVPFCEMRCGFCNLFTLAKPGAERPPRFLDALERQARVTRAALGPAQYARIAVGGGTPTQLDLAGLDAVFDTIEAMGARPIDVPVSCEASPETVTPEKLALLRARGVDRLSIGIQSFLAEETRALGRPQSPAQAHRALEMIRRAGFPTLNLDLIYGIQGQTAASWRASLDAALSHRPEEIYLYPLYVRPLTGLGRSHRAWDDARLALYRQGRDHLRAQGYRQVSMRMFRGPHAPEPDAPPYRCQADGMVGLGPGARSYTRGLHYSCEYAVGRAGVQDILDAYLDRTAEAFSVVDYGFRMDDDEQRRRHLIMSLLSEEGLADGAYGARFGSTPVADYPRLGALVDAGLATQGAAGWRLTDAGQERADAIGPWLTSPAVHARVAAYDAR